MKRFILGKRGSEFGVFISSPGIDASVAPASQLLLHISNKSAQVIIRGVAIAPYPTPIVVPHGLEFAPIVLPNLISTDLVGGFGYVRPFDNSWPPWTYSNIAVDVDNLTVNQTKSDSSAPTLNVYYQILNQEAP